MSKSKFKYKKWKPNDKCPCGSDKKYKKCCNKGSAVGLFILEESEESDPLLPLLRFAVGNRVEIHLLNADKDGQLFTPGTVSYLHHHLNGNHDRLYLYRIRVDSPTGENTYLESISEDTNLYIRPYGYTKSITKYQKCGKCGVHESVEGVELLNCSGCRRIRYCCIEHLHADRKNHKAFCRAIIKENERYKMEIKDIIKTGKVEAVNNALIEAAEGGNLLVVKKLFKKRGDDIDVNAVHSDHNSKGQTALYQSSSYGHIGITTFLLQTKGIDVNKSHTVSGATPLCAASQNGHVELVILLLGAEGIKVNESNTNGATPLFMASQMNHIEIVKLLLGAEGIEIDHPLNGGATPLSFASQEGHVAIVKLMLGANGIQVNKSDKNGATPLFFASQKGQIEVVKLLVGAEGIEINQPANNGTTPLAIAKQKQHTEIVQLLKAAGATE